MVLPWVTLYFSMAVHRKASRAASWVLYFYLRRVRRCVSSCVVVCYAPPSSTKGPYKRTRVYKGPWAISVRTFACNRRSFLDALIPLQAKQAKWWPWIRLILPCCCWRWWPVPSQVSFHSFNCLFINLFIKRLLFVQLCSATRARVAILTCAVVTRVWPIVWRVPPTNCAMSWELNVKTNSVSPSRIAKFFPFFLFF